MEELKELLQRIKEASIFSNRQLAGLILLSVILFGGILIVQKSSKPKRVEFKEYDMLAEGEAQEAAEKEIVIHVCGAVNAEDVYTCLEGDRVKDAIDKAGGARADADLNSLNLAAKLVDGQRVYIPTIDERLAAQPFTGSNFIENSLININQATSDELEKLTGIGPTIAERIVEYRNDNGPFQRAEDLLKVKGIGEKKFESLKDEVSVY
ncbi:MAG: helix-hairpin-helix domain-containing protein [Actinomycetota bacterium]|nr:helix-hairpin-helix domain-containing protein [Actinomycetota bacterium]